MRDTTSPPRWTRPRIGGLSLASVPRPGAPLSRRRRPGRPLWRRRPGSPCARRRRRPRRSRPRPPAAPAGAWRRARGGAARSWPARRSRPGPAPARSAGSRGSGPSGTGTRPRPAAVGGDPRAPCRSGRRSAPGSRCSGSAAAPPGCRHARGGSPWRRRRRGSERHRASAAGAPGRSTSRRRSGTRGSRGWSRTWAVGPSWNPPPQRAAAPFVTPLRPTPRIPRRAWEYTMTEYALEGADVKLPVVMRNLGVSDTTIATLHQLGMPDKINGDLYTLVYTGALFSPVFLVIFLVKGLLWLFPRLKPIL